MSQRLSYDAVQYTNISPGSPQESYVYSQPMQISWICPAPFLEFTPERVEYLTTAMTKVLRLSRSPSEWKFDRLSFMKEPERSFLHDFLVNLSAFAESVPSEYWILHPIYILAESIQKGPEFAKTLSTFKDYVLIRKTRRYIPEYEYSFSGFLYMHKMVDKIPDAEFQVGHIYRYNQLLKWKPPPFDYKTVVDLPVIFKPGILKAFREELRDYLHSALDSNIYRPVQLYEVVSDTPSATRNGPVWKQDLPVPAKYRGVSKMVQVPRDLKECRAAAVEDLSSVLRIQWIETAVSRILRNDGRNALVYDVDKLKKIMDKKLSLRKRKKAYSDSDYPTSYCRDFQKEGLTKPRILLRIMLEELHALYPNEEAFQETEFFDNWTVYDEHTKPYCTQRGHGLGMANALTTLMQIVIEGLTTKFSGVTPVWACYQNDDATVILRNWLDAKTYRSFDIKICRDLSLDFKAKSSFLSMGHAVLCEVYSCTSCPKINQKDSFIKAAAYNIYKCVNTAHARHMYLSGAYEGLTDQEIEQIKRYWGYVLYKNETQNMSLFGGWRRETLNTVRTDFFGSNSKWKLTKNDHAALVAYKQTRLEIQPWLREEVREPKIKKLLNPLFFDIFEPPKISNKTMFRLSEHCEENTDMWIRFQKILTIKFRSLLDELPEMTFKDLYIKTVDENILSDFIPPFGEEEVGYVTQLIKMSGDYENPTSGFSLRDLYDGWLAQPFTVQYLAKTCFGKFHNVLRIATEDIKSTLAFKFQTRAHFVNKDYIVHFDKSPVPPDQVFNRFHDPFIYYKVMDDLLGNYKILLPKYIPTDKAALLYQREAFVPNNARYWIDFARLRPRERLLFSFYEKKSLSTRALRELIETFRKYRAVGNHLPFSSDGPMVSEKLMELIRHSELIQNRNIIQGERNLLYRYIEPNRFIWFDYDTLYETGEVNIEELIEEEDETISPLDDFIKSLGTEFTETEINLDTGGDLRNIQVLDEVKDQVYIVGLEKETDEITNLIPDEDMTGYDAFFGTSDNAEEEYLDLPPEEEAGDDSDT